MGLTVKVVAVSALVAQDSGDVQGMTVASAFNSFATSTARFDNLSYEHAKTDIFLFDKVSLASLLNGQTM